MTDWSLLQSIGEPCSPRKSQPHLQVVEDGQRSSERLTWLGGPSRCRYMHLTLREGINSDAISRLATLMVYPFCQENKTEASDTDGHTDYEQ